MTLTERRPIGQQSVAGLHTSPLEEVRVAIIGLGHRGLKALERLQRLPEVRITALADQQPEALQQAQQLLPPSSPASPALYSGERADEEALASRRADLAYICTDWSSHAAIATKAMHAGLHVAVEVPAAMQLREIQTLVDTSEQTARHCVQLENCLYAPFELSALSLLSSAALGELLHAKGGYIHSLLKYWKDEPQNWRLDYNRRHRGDLYPTHALLPILLSMDIQRGDRLATVVSMETASVFHARALEQHWQQAERSFKNAAHTQTMIRTLKGKTIYLEHDVSTARPYSRALEWVCSHGYIRKYPEPAIAMGDPLQLSASSEVSYLSAPELEQLLSSYQHPILTPEARQLIAGLPEKEAMSMLMDYRLVYCLKRGLPPDTDVYDLAASCCIIPLSEESLTQGSSAVSVPDFSRGAWQDAQRPRFLV